MYKRFIGRLTLSAKVSITVIALISLSIIGALTATIVQQIGQQAESAATRQLASLRAAAAILERDLAGFDVDWTAEGEVARVTMADGIPAVFDQHRIIDSVGRVTGETATLFGWDAESGDFWRRTTNIVKPDGNRAVGTPLGTKGAVFPVVHGGETFFGEAVILGLPYYTVYNPVFDAAGEGGVVEGSTICYGKQKKHGVPIKPSGTRTGWHARIYESHPKCLDVPLMNYRIRR